MKLKGTYKTLGVGLSLLLSFAGAFPLRAQNEYEIESEERILELIEQSAIADYDIPTDILTNIGTNPSQLRRPGTTKVVTTRTSGVKKMQGYRIQVFSDGRNPSTLQARARARGNAIIAKFPKYRDQVYSYSSAPNWYTRVGNFSTSSEAKEALAELKKAFPSFADEMRIVKSQITIIK